jgi:phosphate butyryltransferase
MTPDPPSGEASLAGGGTPPGPDRGGIPIGGTVKQALRAQRTDAGRRFSSLAELLDAVRAAGPRRMVVALPHDRMTLDAVAIAVRHGVARPILVGRRETIEREAGGAGLDLSACTILDGADPEFVRHAVLMVQEEQADFLMKGLVHTGHLLRMVMDRQWGIRSTRLLSHVALFEHPREHRLLLLTDAGVNIDPNIGRKLDILRNAVETAVALGIPRPRAAVIAAVETVRLPAMPATLHGALIKRYAAAGRLGLPCDVDGPLALDIAVSPEKAAVKGVGGPVAGRADILLVPNIESGNIFYKVLTSLHGQEMAGVVVGARCPLVVPSRADSAMTKLYSIAFGSWLSGAAGHA